MKTFSFAASALCLSLMTGSAEGAVLFEFVEYSDRVVGTLSGSLDLTGLAPVATNVDPMVSGMHAETGFVGFGGELGGEAGWIYAVSGPKSFGSGGLRIVASSATQFAVRGAGNLTPDSPGWLIVPEGFVVGGVSGTLTFLGESFQTLGVDPGTYVYTLRDETVTISFGPAAIPVPATLPLLLGALGLGLAAARRRA